MTVVAPPAPDPFGVAADIFDPPAWSPADRPPLEPHQVPPAGEWTLWLLEAGRGAGKTEACARYFAGYMRAHPGHRGRIIAPTLGDAVEACVEGPSGLLAMDPAIRWLPTAVGGSKVVWPNGSEALVIGTPFPKDVERLRAGGNRHLDWWEEAAANPQLKKAWDQAELGLRLGLHPHSIASTTPRNTSAYRRLRAIDGAVRTRGTIDDNPHLNEDWREAIKTRHAGTRLGRQELGGELLEDVEGALWSPEVIEKGRVEAAPELATIVVAIDPAATSGPEADDTGMAVVGKGVNGHGYLLADRTCHLEPGGWGSRAVQAYYEFESNRIVAETNNGGEMVEHVIRTVDATVPFKSVTASRGKQTRAEPIATLYQDLPGRKAMFHHVGTFPDLEDQLCTWEPGDKSPDRLDALVWGASDLMLGKQSTWRPL